MSRTEFEDRSRLFIVSRQIRFGERPPAMRNPLALLKIMFVQRTAKAVPKSAIPADNTGASTIDPLSRKAHTLTAAKVTSLLIERESSTFDNAGFDSQPIEFLGNRNAGYAGPDNTYVHFQDGSKLDFTGIDEHCNSAEYLRGRVDHCEWWARTLWINDRNKARPFLDRTRRRLNMVNNSNIIQ